jgi:hypothetical protein
MCNVGIIDYSVSGYCGGCRDSVGKVEVKVEGKEERKEEKRRKRFGKRAESRTREG